MRSRRWPRCAAVSPRRESTGWSIRRYVALLEMVPGIDSRIVVNTRRPARTLATLGISPGGLHRRDRSAGAVEIGGAGAGGTRGANDRLYLGASARTHRGAFLHASDRSAAPRMSSSRTSRCSSRSAAATRASRFRWRSHSAVSDSVSARFDNASHAAINPGAAWPNKRWPRDRFGALAAGIRDRCGLRSLVLWGPGEQSLAEEVTRASNGAAELAPATSITDLFAIARRARVLISGDTGPLHIGGAVGLHWWRCSVRRWRVATVHGRRRTS